MCVACPEEVALITCKLHAYCLFRVQTQCSMCSIGRFPIAHHPYLKKLFAAYLVIYFIRINACLMTGMRFKGIGLLMALSNYVKVHFLFRLSHLNNLICKWEMPNESSLLCEVLRYIKKIRSLYSISTPQRQKILNIHRFTLFYRK